MTRILRKIVALFACLAALFQVPAAAEVLRLTEEGRAAQARPALWKIADKDTTIWLFGTIHALPDGIAWFSGPVSEAFEASDELVTEIVPEEPATMQRLVLDKAVMDEATTLRSLMADTDRAEFEAALGTLELPPESFDRFEPWYAAVTLSTIPLLRDGFQSKNGVEETLALHATEAEMPHAGLETAEQQLSMFDSLPVDVQVRYLDDVVEQLPGLRQDLLSMVEAWKIGDAARLAELINAEEDEPALVEALLTGRNRAWAGWISERMQKPGTVFLAVGAGHLAGPGSVQQQLETLGISAQRIQ
ncbi:hypothetical protein GCM10011371_05030 [Novosphingobium marinum]|uniref:TraB/GumN family protein n=1 Tax=Novosphingobium marinum TaxID=1514948 RepID=A0A7Z0BUH7_9SPHN|nr:TraB/GumN family protein [Novosphingobium marinum]NYH94192.1 hypothetical protein [Novosphingobium marinum]GGC20355.1 hypothetical protein GCM10011371_05030 [Novosphingobium marinum]